MICLFAALPVVMGWAESYHMQAGLCGMVGISGPFGRQLEQCCAQISNLFFSCEFQVSLWLSFFKYLSKLNGL